MDPADLTEVLNVIPPIMDSRFLGRNHEDAAAIQITENLAIVQTVDLITPILNDPYRFGAVAAVNSVSDIYAMGANPLSALNIVCFPIKALSVHVLTEMLRGGADAMQEAGCVIAGGHTIEDNVPKYGLSVTGTAEPGQLLYKHGAKPGDILFLTKPLGIGVITTAIDLGLATDDLEEKAYNVMRHLNRSAADALHQTAVHACTDVSGYGLLGHLYEMLTASKVSAAISLEHVPVIEEAWNLAKAGTVPSGSHNNSRYIADKAHWHDDIPPEAKTILTDAQTSGGLLISVPREAAEQFEKILNKQGCLANARIGEIIPQTKAAIRVEKSLALLS
ncbi:MAG: selenide, water dikinase SelD [Bacillota bacterium]|nr:selenide, water dikinase SelD [Bacillota bacterium]